MGMHQVEAVVALLSLTPVWVVCTQIYQGDDRNHSTTGKILSCVTFKMARTTQIEEVWERTSVGVVASAVHSRSIDHNSTQW